MARRKRIEERVNHERWLVSYADFITLLFAFFVVMYSISQVNQSKYRVLSNTLNAAFNQPELTLKPVQVGEQARSNSLNPIALDGSARPHDARQNDLPQEFRQLSEEFEQALSGLIEKNLVTLRGNELWLEIELNSSLLFDSGEAELKTHQALELLGQIAEILRTQNNPVRVEGFTDNVPIHTARYPSNWELSSARAAAVVQFFVEEGMDPGRLMAVGYAQYQPIASNDSAEGRGKNRRVVLMISKTGEVRPALRPVAVGADAGSETQPVSSQAARSPIADPKAPAPSLSRPDVSTPAASVPGVATPGTSTSGAKPRTNP